MSNWWNKYKIQMTTPVDKPTKGKEEATNELNYVLVMNDIKTKSYNMS